MQRTLQRPQGVVGVDGCRAGWFAVRLSGQGEYAVAKFASLGELVDSYDDGDLVLVDIPIGLPEDGSPRECDLRARKVLGARGGAVFPAPTRQAAEQARADREDYGAFCDEQCRYTGKRLSRQAFGIAPKIAEVDEVMRRRCDGGPRVREIHPEVCFWALNGKRPMQYSKKPRRGELERHGERERKDILRLLEPRTDRIVDEATQRFLRKDVAKDDILDALAAAVTGYHGYDALRTLPQNPVVDIKGLPMEMVYWLPPQA